MKRKIGAIVLPDHNLKLQYFLIRSEGQFYGLEVQSVRNGVRKRERCENLSADQDAVLQFGKAVMRGLVLPGYLAELVQEAEF